MYTTENLKHDIGKGGNLSDSGSLGTFPKCSSAELSDCKITPDLPNDYNLLMSSFTCRLQSGPTAFRIAASRDAHISLLFVIAVVHTHLDVAIEGHVIDQLQAFDQREYDESLGFEEPTCNRFWDIE
jgi:hypothetical protein